MNSIFQLRAPYIEGIEVIKVEQSQEFLALLWSSNSDYTQGAFFVCADMKEAISLARRAFNFKGGSADLKAGIVDFKDKAGNDFVLSVSETEILSQSVVATWRKACAC